jgi:class 3 adenylate cyclase
MNRRYMAWIDANGFTRLTLLNGTGALLGPTLTTVQTTLVAQSNADVLNSVENTLTTNTPFPPGAVYRSVGDAAILTFQDGSGNLVDITLPAPLSSVFLADGVTVDSSAIALIIGSVIGTVVTPAGGTVSAYVAGYRRTRKGEVY